MEPSRGSSSISARPSKALSIVLFMLFLSMVTAVGAQIGAAIAGRSVVGNWTNQETGTPLALALRPDGTGDFNGLALKYSVVGTKLTLAMTGSRPVTYDFLLSGNRLTLSGGDLSRSLDFLPATNPGSSEASAIPPDTAASAPSPLPSPASAGIEGIWDGYGESIEFRAGGSVIYLGKQMNYSISGETLSLSAGGQALPMRFKVEGDRLSLSANGKVLVYARRGAASNAGRGANGELPGLIAPELVGKWAWVNVTNTNSGGISSSESITINADGTYDYYNESAISVNGPDLAGGTASNGRDHGKWRLEGAVLHVWSDSAGYHAYAFEKRNHPKTGDPMIVLDGRTYVTYWQKAPWR